MAMTLLNLKEARAVPMPEPVMCANCGAEIRRADPRAFRNGWAHVQSEDDICELYAQPKTQERKDAA